MLATPAQTDTQTHCRGCVSHAQLEQPTVSSCSHFIAAVSPSYPLNFHRWAEGDKKNPTISSSRYSQTHFYPHPLPTPTIFSRLTHQHSCSLLLLPPNGVAVQLTVRFACHNSLTSSMLGPMTVVQLPMSSTGTSLSS